jgi:hypothetical protein
MSNLSQKKPDYVFIASLIAIIFVAIYLAMDRFKDAHIPDFLHQKGQELLAQISNRQERETLRTEYNKFIKKVEEREVDPQKVEQFVSSIINLNQAKGNLNQDEFAYIFQKNLERAVEADTVDRIFRENPERWKKLQQRLQDISVFEEKIKHAEQVKPEQTKSYSFSYTIDDTLHILIDQQFKDNLVKQAELAKELKRLEKEKTLKWQKQSESIEKHQQALQQALNKVQEVEASVSVIAAGKDSAKVVAPAAPVVATPRTSETPKTPTTVKRK